jgi:putative transposase
VGSVSGGKRGMMRSKKEKLFLINSVRESVSKGCRKCLACKDIGINVRTLQRWKSLDMLVDKRQLVDKKPANRLTNLEKNTMLEILNSKEFRDQNPWEIVAALADNGIYIASESSFYRIMRKENLLGHRSKSRPALHKKPEGFVATGPNQVWSWDITYLKSDIRGTFYYLYMIIDIYSRKIVAWRVNEVQSDELSALLIEEACELEGIKKNSLLVLHSDNGGPMKGATMLATLQKLGVVPSFSRPRVSDDNPYSESLFKTMKYSISFPSKPFSSVKSASKWVSEFVEWYNKERFHGEINYVTPLSRHEGKDKQILKKRREIYEKAKASNPSRWTGKCKTWDHIEKVFLNPTKEQKEVQQEHKIKLQKAA